MLFEEFDQVFAWDTTVLRAGDPVAFEASRIEPLADRARGHFTDLRDLSSCEDLHRRLSIRQIDDSFEAVPPKLALAQLVSPIIAILAFVQSIGRLWGLANRMNLGRGVRFASAWLGTQLPLDARLTE